MQQRFKYSKLQAFVSFGELLSVWVTQQISIDNDRSIYLEEYIEKWTSESMN